MPHKYPSLKIMSRKKQDSCLHGFFITMKFPGCANISSSHFLVLLSACFTQMRTILLCLIIVSSCFSPCPGKGAAPPVLLVLAASFYLYALY